MSVKYRIITLDNGWNFTIQRRRFIVWYTIGKSDNLARAEAKLKDYTTAIRYYDSKGDKICH